MPSFSFIQFSLGYHFFRSFFSDLYRRRVYVNPLWGLQIPQIDHPCFFLSDFVSKFAHLLDGQKTSTTTSLQSRGVSYDPTASRVKIQTNRAAPSREEYISNMQGAFKRGAHNIKAHSNAFAFKKGSPEGTP